MRRFDYPASDLIDWLWWAQPSGTSVATWKKGQWIDMDRFDVVPKKSYIEARLKEKEEQLEALQKEITDLKKSLSP
jgi:hypothetical protein